MTQPPRLTDRDTLLRNRARALRSDAPALFLQEEAVLEVKERLIGVNRTFTSPALVTGFPDLWQNAFPQAAIVTDDAVLALEPGAHDLVIHAMTLHWADDLVGQLVQCRRALRPDGLFLGLMFGGQTLHELRACLAQAETQITGGLSPRVAPMAEIRDLGGLLQRAGFALPVADSVQQCVSYQSPLHLMRDLRAMGEGNALHFRRRTLASKALFQAASSLYCANFPAADDRIEATFEIVVLTGWAPDASQPQALRPGSATGRLADALNTQELPTGDKAGPKNG